MLGVRDERGARMEPRVQLLPTPTLVRQARIASEVGFEPVEERVWIPDCHLPNCALAR